VRSWRVEKKVELLDIYTNIAPKVIVRHSDFYIIIMEGGVALGCLSIINNVAPYAVKATLRVTGVIVVIGHRRNRIIGIIYNSKFKKF